ncbi:hypothetical protein RugamoR57_42940 [Duganella caerulea]
MVLIVDRRFKTGYAFDDVVLFLLWLVVAIHGGLLGGIHHFTPARVRGIAHTIDAGRDGAAAPAMKYVTLISSSHCGAMIM